MSEQSRYDEALPPAPAEQDMPALIRKMQQQLVFLEKKIDILINQSQARPFSENKFSKPFRSSGRPHGHFDRTHVKASGEKSFDRNSQKSDFDQRRHYKKRYDGEKRGFDQKKKPFSYSRKDRG